MASSIINHFQGKYRFLSNFYICCIVYEDLVHISVEHAYQAAKTPILSEKEYIQAMDTPGHAKRAAYAITI